MREFALAQINILGSEDNIFRRLDGRALTSPHRLAWFGGEIDREQDTDTRTAIVRNLLEQTPWNIEPQDISERTIHRVPVEYSSSKEPLKVYLFRTAIQPQDANLNLLKRSGAERYSNEELLQRNDVSSTVRFILEHMDES